MTIALCFRLSKERKTIWSFPYQRRRKWNWKYICGSFDRHHLCLRCNWQMCNDNVFFHKSQPRRFFFTVCQIQVFVLSCYLIIFYSKLVHIPKLFLATFNVAFSAFVEETCCKFFSTKGHSAECKEQSYNEQGCPYQNWEIHGPRVKG